jgi:hypothetical protein
MIAREFSVATKTTLANPRTSVLPKGYHHDVIDVRQVVIGVSMGSVLLVFGLVPGLFQGLVEGVRNVLASFQSGNLLSPRFLVHPARQAQFGQPISLAATGAALIVLTLLA